MTTEEMPAPYKSQYTFTEFWGELTQSSMWRNYVKSNPKESAVLIEHAEKKIGKQADFIPTNLTTTHFGNAILMALLTLYV